MTRYAGSAVLRTTVTAFLVAATLVAGGVVPAAATTGKASCPRGPAAVTAVSYVVFHSDGSSNDVSTLRGNVRLGDIVNALFNVPALPFGCSQVELSLVSYSSSGSPGRQTVFSSDSLEFIPGGRYELSVTVAPPPAPEAPGVEFTLAFATGPVLTRPHYGPDLIDFSTN